MERHRCHCHHHRHVVFTLFLLLLATSASATRPSPTPHPSTIIQSACRTTLYPSVCEQVLSTYPPSSTRTSRGMALAALDASLRHARAAQAFFGTFTRSSASRAPMRSRQAAGAARDCVETMADGVDRIRRSIREMAGIEGPQYDFHMSNVQTWVSAALTDENTCLDGFAAAGGVDAAFKAEVRNRVAGAARVTSNALALVNRVASSSRH